MFFYYHIVNLDDLLQCALKQITPMWAVWTKLTLLSPAWQLALPPPCSCADSARGGLQAPGIRLILPELRSEPIKLLQALYVQFAAKAVKIVEESDQDQNVM